jgi:hypothetical protein
MDGNCKQKMIPKQEANARDRGTGILRRGTGILRRGTGILRRAIGILPVSALG